VNKERLRTLVCALNIGVYDHQLEDFETYYNEMLTWNKKCNLTAITKENEVLVKHFYDSLLVMSLEEWKPQSKVLDLGTGAGLPGIPLKILNENINLTLIDSLNKRVLFLKTMIDTLGLNNTTAIHGRAEELANDSSYREKYDIVVSRAVARLPILLEYCLPFVKVDAYFMAYKGPDADEEIRESHNALAVLGGEITRVIKHELPENGGRRSIILVKKTKQTPGSYPRKPGTPEKKSL